MIVKADEPKPEPTRYVLCDSYAEGCGKGFSVPLSQWNPANGQICPACTRKHNQRAMIETELRMARRFHLDPEGIQVLENQLDSVDGYDWREGYDEKLDRLTRGYRKERTAGGAVY